MNRNLPVKLAAVALTLIHVSCGQAILTAPLDAEIILIANPKTIAASGGVAIISAVVTETETGTPVPDGTVVQFFTDLGDIEEQGKTNDGVARVKLVADARSGTATVSAISGFVVAEDVKVTIGNAAVKQIVLRANPARIPPNSNTTHVFAAVFDESGNPVPNVPVFFSVVSSSPAMATEFFVTSGPVFTNNNGEAENVLRTNRQTAGEVKVTATVPGAPAAVVSPLGGLTIPIQ